MSVSPLAQKFLKAYYRYSKKISEDSALISKFLDPKFPHQNKFIEDKSKYIVAQCSRRAGKSNGLALRFFHTLERHPKSLCVYIALTRESARNIMWPVLIEHNERLNLNCKFLESSLTMVHPNGSRLQLFGADMKNFIKRLKGIKCPGLAIDEAQDFGPHIEELIDDVLTPTMLDYATQGAWLAITGTPGPVPRGYFCDITDNRKGGYSFHSWTLFDNPHIAYPEQFLAELKEKKRVARRSPDLAHPVLQQVGP